MPLVLIIEDEADIRTLYKRILEHAGYEVIEAADGQAGTAAFRRHHPDLVITDIIMPDKEGIETIMELTRDFSGVKIIAISGGGETMDSAVCLQLAKRLGASATLAKPFGQKELLDAVRAILGQG
jgi:DNA-binding response OmpR family regulator